MTSNYINFEELNIHKSYDYLKLFIIHTLSYYGITNNTKFYQTSTLYDKLLSINPNIENKVKNNKISKYFTSILSEAKQGSSYTNISYANIYCQLNNIILKKYSIDNIDKLLFVSADIVSCKNITNNIFELSNEIDFLLIPHEYYHSTKYDVLKTVNKYSNRITLQSGYLIDDFVKYVHNNILNFTIKNDKIDDKHIKYNVAYFQYKTGYTLWAPELKFLINGGLCFIQNLITLLQLKNGGTYIASYVGYMNPLFRKIIILNHNLFRKYEKFDNFLVFNNFNITDEQRIELFKLLVKLIKDEKILNSYIEYDEFLNIHLNKIVNNKSFYYTIPQNIIDKHLKNFKSNNKLLKQKLLFDIDIPLNNKCLIELFTDNKQSNYIHERIHYESIIKLNKLNSYIIDHDIKFGEGNYDIDDEFITKVLFDKYNEIINLYREYDIPYNKSYDVFISKQRSLLLDRYISFNSNINTRLIKYQTPVLQINNKTSSYYYDDLAPFYKQIDNSYIIRNNVIELVNSKLNPHKYIPGRDDGVVPEIITRIFSQYTRGISAYLSEHHPIPPEISNVKTVSNGFCKLWEIYHIFDIFGDCKRKNIEPNVFHFCEAPGQWIIATRYFLSKRFPEYMKLSLTTGTINKNIKNVNDISNGGGKSNKLLKKGYKNQQSKKIEKSSQKLPFKSLLKSILSPISKKISKRLSRNKILNKKKSQNVLNRGKIFKGFKGDFKDDKYQKQPDIIPDYKWIANSLNPNCELNYRDFGSNFTIKDEYKIIKNNANRWLWGADNSGNICRSINIKWYRDYLTRTGKTTLVTGDAGFTTDAPPIVLQQLEIAQMIMVMATCGIGGSCVIKHFTPYMKSDPTGSIKSFGTFYNMLYTYYMTFDYVSLFKPYCSNPNSGEFYIIGKGFKGISDNNLNELYKIIDNFQLNQCWIPESDIPHKFVQQINNFLSDMAQFNKFALDSSILALTCLYNEDIEFRKLSGCNDFLDEKKLYNMQVQQFKHWIKEHNFS